MIALYVALGGAAGAALRFLLGHHLDGRLPLGTLLANVVGSFLFGVFSAMSVSGTLSSEAVALLGTGFCGAFTTYSALAVKSVELGRVTGTAYALGTVVLAVAAACLGASLV